jgi:hypothetical protein
MTNKRKGQKMKTQSEIKINNVVRETEKAICVNVDVCWNAGRKQQKDLWFPKSTCEVVEMENQTNIIADDSMIQSIIIRNTFHGYEMHFYYCNNPRFAAFN